MGTLCWPFAVLLFSIGLDVFVDIHITFFYDKYYHICSDCLDLSRPGHWRISDREKHTMTYTTADEVDNLIIPVGAISNPPARKPAFPKLPQHPHLLLHLSQAPPLHLSEQPQQSPDHLAPS